MRLSGLAVAVVLLFSSAVLAQHSSAGGSSSGGSSGSSGSSHSSSFSSSSGSSGGHSAGGSSSSSHGTGSGSSRSSSSVGRGGNLSSSPSARASAQPEKRTFVSHIFHPFRKTQAQLVQADFRRPICTKGHCVCPGGGTTGKNGACSTAPLRTERCNAGAFWNGGACVGLTDYRVNDCAALQRLMEQQAGRMRMAENSRLDTCSGGPGAQECGELTTRSADESARYRALQQQYEQCRRRQFTSNRYGFSFANYGAAGLRDPFNID